MTVEWFLAAACAIMFGGLALAIFLFDKLLDNISDWKVRENYVRRAGRELMLLCLGCSVVVTITLGYLTCEYLL